MTKHEFEIRSGQEVTDDDYEIIEKVYTWHPVISETEGKEQIVTLYKTGGMPLINSMMEAASLMMDLEKEKNQAMGRLRKIHNRIRMMKKGNIAEERCRREAREMFDKSNDPTEWGYAKIILAAKYGEELASEIIKEVETC